MVVMVSSRLFGQGRYFRRVVVYLPIKYPVLLTMM